MGGREQPVGLRHSGDPVDYHYRTGLPDSAATQVGGPSRVDDALLRPDSFPPSPLRAWKISLVWMFHLPHRWLFTALWLGWGSCQISLVAEWMSPKPKKRPATSDLLVTLPNRCAIGMRRPAAEGTAGHLQAGHRLGTLVLVEIDPGAESNELSWRRNPLPMISTALRFSST